MTKFSLRISFLFDRDGHSCSKNTSCRLHGFRFLCCLMTIATRKEERPNGNRAENRGDNKNDSSYFTKNYDMISRRGQQVKHGAEYGFNRQYLDAMLATTGVRL